MDWKEVKRGVKKKSEKQRMQKKIMMVVLEQKLEENLSHAKLRKYLGNYR